MSVSVFLIARPGDGHNQSYCSEADSLMSFALDLFKSRLTPPPPFPLSLSLSLSFTFVRLLRTSTEFSCALGAETYGLGHSASKEEAVKKMGAKALILTKDPKAVLAEHAGSFDMLLLTSFQKGLDLAELYLPLLKPRGVLSIVGLPEEAFPPMQAFSLLGKSIAGSLIGTPQEIEEMLALAVEKNVRPWVEVRPMSEVSQAVQDMENGLAKFR